MPCWIKNRILQGLRRDRLKQKHEAEEDLKSIKKKKNSKWKLGSDGRIAEPSGNSGQERSEGK